MTLIVGHRGAAGYAPENTLLSFQMAIDLGCRFTECDVRLSKDKKVVVIHDPFVGRVTDGRGRVARMTLAQLKELNCRDNQKIPTLQEVIDVCRGKINLQIELKSKGTPKAVEEILKKNRFTKSVVVLSFYPKLLKQIKKLNPKVKICYLFKKYSKGVWNRAKNLQAHYIGPRSTIVTKGIVNKAHQAGLKVYAYHVNTKKMANRLIKLGVDEIGTDFPRLFISS